MSELQKDSLESKELSDVVESSAFMPRKKIHAISVRVGI